MVSANGPETAPFCGASTPSVWTGYCRAVRRDVLVSLVRGVSVNLALVYAYFIVQDDDAGVMDSGAYLCIHTGHEAVQRAAWCT